VLVCASCGRSQPPGAAIPRTSDGKPNFQGVWQVRNTAASGLEDHVARHGMLAGRSVVDGGAIPYRPEAARKRVELAASQASADPLEKCYMPGVPRIMYLDFPFQIFQTPSHIAIAFEWSLVHRVIYTNGATGPDGIDFWMGDSRGRWDGDTLVVDVKDQNDKTWFDTTGTFHSDKLHVVERYTMTDANTIATRRRSRTQTCSRSRGRSRCRCIGRPIAIGSSNTSARRSSKKPAAISSAISARGTPDQDRRR
jgi:hypothetical protein